MKELMESSRVEEALELASHQMTPEQHEMVRHLVATSMMPRLVVKDLHTTSVLGGILSLPLIFSFLLAPFFPGVW